MYSLKIIVLSLFIALAIFPASSYGEEWEASVPPVKKYLFKFYPKIFFTSAFFSEEGKALNLPKVTGLLYIVAPVHVQYGYTKSLAFGAVLPIGLTYQEIIPTLRPDPITRFTVRELWLTVQHRWWTVPFISSSSIRIKIPLASKKNWEDGLRIGDNQIDIYPIYYFSYFSKNRYWYTDTSIGYKYRFKKDNIKPFDEYNFRSLLGYELIPDFQLRFFLFADLTAFRNGDFDSISPTEIQFFQNEGSLHTFGYGLSMWLRPETRLEISTAGDWSGRNQYRGMKWSIGIVKII